jgi:hypothetical protein
MSLLSNGGRWNETASVPDDRLVHSELLFCLNDVFE